MRREMFAEYDGYTLPETRIKEETPETRKKLAELWEEAKAMAERHHKEAEAREALYRNEAIVD